MTQYCPINYVLPPLLIWGGVHRGLVFFIFSSPSFSLSLFSLPSLSSFTLSLFSNIFLTYSSPISRRSIFLVCSSSSPLPFYFPHSSWPTFSHSVSLHNSLTFIYFHFLPFCVSRIPFSLPPSQLFTILPLSPSVSVCISLHPLPSFPFLIPSPHLSSVLYFFLFRSSSFLALCLSPSPTSY